MWTIWYRDTYTIFEMPHDYDLKLKAFAVVQGDTAQMIIPATLDDMAEIIQALDAGEDVDGWDDGMGNTITIKAVPEGAKEKRND